MDKTKKKEKVEVSKDLGVKLYKLDNITEKTKDGEKISCPTLAYAHVIMESPFGDMIMRGFRVLRGKKGNPFIARPGRTRQLFDKNGKPAGTQRFNDIHVDGSGDKEFFEAVSNKILSSFEG